MSNVECVVASGAASRRERALSALKSKHNSNMKTPHTLTNGSGLCGTVEHRVVREETLNRKDYICTSAVILRNMVAFMGTSQ